MLAAIWENHVSCVKLLLNKVNLIIIMRNIYIFLSLKGASRSTKAPDGRSLIETTDNDEIKKLLKF